MIGGGDEEALRRLFGRAKEEVAVTSEAVAPPVEVVGTAAEGGNRTRLTVRVDAETAEGLAIIVAGGAASKNGFCEDVLRRSVRAKVAALKAGMEPAEWDVLMKLVKRRQSGGARRRGGGGSV